MTSVSYRGIEKRFDDVVALHALDLEVPDGAFLVLLGPSGCGKTTALRVLAGLELPTAGRVLIGERDVTRLQPRDRDVAMVFQSYALYPHMTVEENIAYPLRVRRVPTAERARAVQQVAVALEVEHLLKRRPRQLSGGQRQRIALARAIVRQPSAFLMDEPLSNLDARLRADDARRDQAPAAPARHDHALRHARPGRGDDDGRPRRRHARGRAAAARAAARGLRAAGQPLRRDVRRQPAHERARGRMDADARALVVARRPPPAERGPPRALAAPALAEVGVRPEDAHARRGRERPTPCAARSTSSSPWATRRSSTSASATPA